MNKRILFVMIVISLFVLVVSLSSMYVQMKIMSGDICSCIIPIQLFVPFLSSVGVFIGMLVYSFLTESKEIDKSFVLNFFEGDERKVLEVILKNKENITQSRIVKETGISKVRVFRILEKLKSKGIIEKEPYGKTNIVKLKL